MGDGRAEGSSAIGDRGQSQISLMPHADGTGSASLLDSIPSTLLKKQSSDVWVLALFLLTIGNTVTLDCILNSCCNLCVPVYIWVLGLKTLSVSAQIKYPCRFLCHESLWFFSYFFFLLSLSFFWASSSIRSSLVSSACCSQQYCAVKYTKAQPLVEDGRM